MLRSEATFLEAKNLTWHQWVVHQGRIKYQLGTVLWKIIFDVQNYVIKVTFGFNYLWDWIRTFLPEPTKHVAYIFQNVLFNASNNIIIISMLWNNIMSLLRQQCQHENADIAYQKALHWFSQHSGRNFFFFLTDLLTYLPKTELKLVNVNRIKHSFPYKNVAKLFPESKNELWNCDASVSGSFIGMLWLFLINLFSAGLWNHIKITSNCSFSKLWRACFVCWDSKNQFMWIRKKCRRKRII